MLQSTHWIIIKTELKSIHLFITVLQCFLNQGKFNKSLKDLIKEQKIYISNKKFIYFWCLYLICFSMSSYNLLDIILFLKMQRIEIIHIIFI